MTRAGLLCRRALVSENYDPDHKFSFTDDLDISRAEQWMAWQHGGLGPMQGQANHFNRLAKERIAYGMQRYTGETERLVGILDNHLKDTDYLVGNKFSIADIASFGWIHALRFSGVELEQFPNVKAWWERIFSRPAVERGLSIPSKPGIGNDGFLQKMKDDKEFAEKEHAMQKKIQEAKEQYGYKYSSP
jgi:glutathione S-transferase